MLPSNPFFEFGPAGWPTIIAQIVGPTLLAIGLWVRPISLLMLLADASRAELRTATG
jgi:uncharacterized membrane protein YphA (DoxX/SURF4 family)